MKIVGVGILFILIIGLVSANTETFLVDRTGEYFEDVIIDGIKLDLNKNLEKASKDIILSFDPKILVLPDDNQQRSVMVDLSPLRRGYKYFIKVCWSAMNPISISIGSPNPNLLIINATTNYYSNDREQASKFLSSVPINLRIEANDTFGGILSGSLVCLIRYIVTLSIGAVLFAFWFYTYFFKVLF